MTLRQRLLVASLAVGLPLAAVLFYAAERVRLRGMNESLTRYMSSAEFLDAKARCELDPQRAGQLRRGGPGPRGRPGGPPGGPPIAPRRGRSLNDATSVNDGLSAGPSRSLNDPGSAGDRRAEPGLVERPPGLAQPSPGGPPPGGALPPPPPPEGRDGGPGQRPPFDGGGPAQGPPFEVFAYDASFQPANPDAPVFPDDLKTVLTSPVPSLSTYSTPEGRGVQTAVGTESRAGACAVMLVRMRPRAGEIRDERIALGVVIVTVLAAVWIAAGPVIVRMRRLKDAVGRSAESRYRVPVPIDGGGELGDLARAFNDAGASVRRHLDDAEAREKTLREFVANTTHDVALPLTVLQGHLAELDRSTAAGTPEREHIQAAVQEAHYMGSLLRNLGAATKLDSGAAPLSMAPVDLNALIERVVNRHRPIARLCGVELNHAVPEETTTIAGDVTLLEQAVSNLVDNAIRYNHIGGHVAVLLERQKSRFTVAVADDGPGVAADEIARLTERRYRGEMARTRRPDGHGIGLSIAAEAAARLGLVLSFRPSPESGLIAEISGNLV